MSCAIYYANLVLLIVFCVLALLKILKVHDGFTSGSGPMPIFLYMQGCPHCHNMMPAWEKLQRGKAVEYKTPEGQKYLELARAAGIYRGFPCVFAVNSSNKIISTYDGDRSYNSLSNWVAGL